LFSQRDTHYFIAETKEVCKLKGVGKQVKRCIRIHIMPPPAESRETTSDQQISKTKETVGARIVGTLRR